MNKKRLTAFVIMLLFVASEAAISATDANEMMGRIVSSNGSRGISGVSISLVDKEGTVMDVVETGKDGVYVLDLGVLDTVSPNSVMSLYLEIESKSGRKSRAHIADVLNSYSATVTIKNIVAP